MSGAYWAKLISSARHNFTTFNNQLEDEGLLKISKRKSLFGYKKMQQLVVVT